MFSWIKNSFGLKNLIILTLVILAIAGGIKGPSWYKMVAGSQFNGYTKALVTNIDAKNSTVQHYNGAGSIVVGYDVSYIYRVGNNEFSNTEYLKADYDISLVCKQFDSGKSCLIGINYSRAKPYKSFISKVNLK
jgi:hypothetical protein